MIIDPEIRQAIKELKDEGLIEWNGEWRNGQKVYVITTKGIISADKIKKETEK